MLAAVAEAEVEVFAVADAAVVDERVLDGWVASPLICARMVALKVPDMSAMLGVRTVSRMWGRGVTYSNLAE